jgi:hypothetical protein
MFNLDFLNFNSVQLHNVCVQLWSGQKIGYVGNQCLSSLALDINSDNYRNSYEKLWKMTKDKLIELDCLPKCFDINISVVNTDVFISILDKQDSILTDIAIDGKIDNFSNIKIKNNRLVTLGVGINGHKLKPSLYSVKQFTCSSCEWDTIDLNNLINLEELICRYMEVSNLHINKLRRLKYVECKSCSLHKLDVKNLVNLRSLVCGYNCIKTLDIDQLSKLEILVIDNNNIEQLKFNNPNLEVLYIHDNPISEIVLNPTNTYIPLKLEKLYCSFTAIKTLDLTCCPNLKSLDCSNNVLKKLDISRNSRLTSLCCDNNNITQLDLKRNKILLKIECVDNDIEKIDISELEHLITLRINQDSTIVTGKKNHPDLRINIDDSSGDDAFW